MSYNDLGQFSPSNLRHGWTKQAVECYNLNGECDFCKIPRMMSKQCQMKATVLELFKKYGRPTSENTRGNYR